MKREKELTQHYGFDPGAATLLAGGELGRPDGRAAIPKRIP